MFGFVQGPPDGGNIDLHVFSNDEEPILFSYPEFDCLRRICFCLKYKMFKKLESTRNCIITHKYDSDQSWT